MPWQDVILLIEDLTPSWSYEQENAAMVVDTLNYWLEAEYVKWTTSPEEAKRIAARSKNREAAPMPIIRPVAARPAKIHAEHMRRFEELTAEYADRPAPQHKQMDGAELMQFLGMSPDRIRRTQ